MREDRADTSADTHIRIQLQDLLQEIDATIGIAPLVVVPADQLEKAAIEFDAGACIKDTRTRIMQEICRNHFVFGIAKNSLQIGLAGCLHSGTDLLVAGLLGGSKREI